MPCGKEYVQVGGRIPSLSGDGLMGMFAQEDLNAEQNQVQTDLNNMATEQAGHLTGAGD